MYQTKMLKTGATFSCQKQYLNYIYEKASYNTDQVICDNRSSNLLYTKETLKTKQINRKLEKIGLEK